MIQKSITKSAAFMVSAQLLAKILDFAAIIIIARALTPEDFGLVAIATSFMMIVNSITEIPVIDSLINKKEIDNHDINSAFSISIIRGIFVSLIIYASSGPISVIFSDERLYDIIRFLSIVPLVSSISSPMMAHQLKSVDYKSMAISQLIGKLSSFFMMLLTFWLTKSYWAIVVSFTTNPVAYAICTYFFAPYFPAFSLKRVNGIIKFSGLITISRSIFTINQQADKFFIGYILGKRDLGQYSMAGDVSSIATYTIATPIIQPLFAGLSRISGDRTRLKHAYLKGQQTIFSVIAPIGCIFAVLSGRLVDVALGPEWEKVVPLIWWLAPTISLQMLSIPTQSLSLAVNRPAILITRECISFIVRLPFTLLAGWAFGLLAAVVARSVASVIMTFFMLSIASKILDSSILDQLINCWRSIISIVAMIVVSILLDNFIGAQNNLFMQILSIFIVCITGALAYTLCLFCLWMFSGRPNSVESWVIDGAVGRLMK